MIAVVGGGLFGLSIARALLAMGMQVTLFEKKEIGAGASGAAIGILNPYVGPWAQKSLLADEGITASQALFRAVGLNPPSGLIRILPREKHKGDLPWHSGPLTAYGKSHPGYFLIEEGSIVQIGEYLKLLAQDIPISYEPFSKAHIPEFRHVIFAIGGDLRNSSFWGGRQLRIVKGQLLTCRIPSGMEPFDRPLLGDVHIVPTGERGVVRIGASYEHQGLDEGPDIETALAYLGPKLNGLIEDFKSCQILDCQSGLRIAPANSHLPLFWDPTETTTVATGLGSRGLLYHALYGKKVAEHIRDLYT